MMGYYNRNIIDDTTWEYPRTGFWLLHIVGAVLIFMWGMKFALRRAALPVVGYRFMRMLRRR